MLLYSLDQGRETQKKLHIDGSALIVISGTGDFTLRFGSGMSGRTMDIKQHHLSYLFHHLLFVIGAPTPAVMSDPVGLKAVRDAEETLRARGHGAFNLIIVTNDGHLDPNKPSRILNEVRKHCEFNSSVTGKTVCTPTEVVQAISKSHDVGLGIWPDVPDTFANVTYREIEIVPSFHSSLRKIMSGGAKNAADTLLPRNIRLQD